MTKENSGKASELGPEDEATREELAARNAQAQEFRGEDDLDDFAVATRVEREVMGRQPASGKPPKRYKVWLREFTFRDDKRRRNAVLDDKKAKKGRGTGLDLAGTDVFDIKNGVVDWDFIDPTTGAKFDWMDNNDLARIPKYLTDQVLEHVRELNAIADDETDDEENPT